VTIYYNWPPGYEPDSEDGVKVSRDAGAAVIRAIEASMRLLRGYETPDTWEPHAAQEMAEHLSEASTLYGRLEERAPRDPILVPSDSRRALAGALAFAEVAGRILLRASIIDLQIVADGPGRNEEAVSAKSLMRMARRLTKDASNNLPGLALDPSESAAGRRIAADIAVIQLVGVLVARILYQNHVFSKL
jgi:hypothetical protein